MIKLVVLLVNLLFVTAFFSSSALGSFIEKEISPDQYFILEKIDNTDILAHWENLAQKNQGKMEQIQDTKKKGELYLGFGQFINQLSIIKKLIGSPNLVAWIAYVSNKRRPAQAMAKFEDIEMAVTVSTSSEAWFYSPMGISRWLGSNTKHPNISLNFLAFIGQEVKKQVPSLKYMITSPAISLFNLLKKQVPEQYFMYYYRSLYETIIDGDKNKLFWQENKLPVLSNENYYFFYLNPVQRGVNSYTIAIPIFYFEKLLLN